MTIDFFIISLILYFACSIAYLLDLSLSSERLSRYKSLLLLAGLIFHSAALVGKGFSLGRFPVVTIYEKALLVAWVVVLVYLIAEHKTKFKIFGSLVVPLVFIDLSYALFLSKEVPSLAPGLEKFLFYVHIFFFVLGFVALVVIFAGGIMYIFQEDQLKAKKFGKFYYRLPSLETLDKLNYRALVFGFPLLTLGMVFGALWANYSGAPFWNWGDPIQIWTLITWLIYAVLLQGRLTAGWRGRRASILAIIGFCAVIITLLGVVQGSHLFLENNHLKP
jgi:cytochrome c-type biogenesis protein CcsB